MKWFNTKQRVIPNDGSLGAIAVKDLLLGESMFICPWHITMSVEGVFWISTGIKGYRLPRGTVSLRIFKDLYGELHIYTDSVERVVGDASVGVHNKSYESCDWFIRFADIQENR